MDLDVALDMSDKGGDSYRFLELVGGTRSWVSSETGDVRLSERGYYVGARLSERGCYVGARLSERGCYVGARLSERGYYVGTAARREAATWGSEPPVANSRDQRCSHSGNWGTRVDLPPDHIRRATPPSNRKLASTTIRAL
jgi:hypothetical protein